MNALVVRGGLPAARAPEHRLAVGGIGLGELVAKQFALIGVRRYDLRRRGQFEARLVEALRFSRPAKTLLVAAVGAVEASETGVEIAAREEGLDREPDQWSVRNM